MEVTLAVDTPVLTATGPAPLGLLKVGDIVFDRDGKPARIIHRSKRFSNPTYKVTLTSGERFVANEDHIHVVQKRTQKGVRGKAVNTWEEFNYTTRELLDHGIHYNRRISERNPSGRESRWFIPLVSAPVQLASHIRPAIDPYLYGGRYLGRWQYC